MASHDEVENRLVCDECGEPLIEEEDVEEGLHFLCGEFNGEEDEDFQPDEGGESG